MYRYGYGIDYPVIILFSLVVLGVVLAFSAIIANEFAKIAQEKGYDGRRYWHFCFWLGFIGYAIVIALPNRKLTELTRTLVENSKSLQKKESGQSFTSSASQNKSNYLPEL